LLYCYDLESRSQEELLRLVKDNPTVFVKCTFRVSTTSDGQQIYYGQLPTPDSPDIDIPGQVRGVFDGDLIVLELQRSAYVLSDEQLDEDILIFGYIRGEHNLKLRLHTTICRVDFAQS
jgi:hypothetical protein